jgi:HK97 family phage major capsid protein
VIDLARNRTVVFRAGAQTVPMTSQTLALARLTSEGTPAWKTENAAITAADMVFERVTFTARTLVRLITLSVELFEDADPSSEDVIARAFAGRWPSSWTGWRCSVPARHPNHGACSTSPASP